MMQGIEEKMAATGARALLVGGVAGVAAVVGAVAQPQAFFQAYLMGYIFWLSIALGSLVTLMIHHLTGGAWLFVIRRPLEAAARTLPLLGLLFIPLILGMQYLYPWSVPEIVAADKYIQFKTPYLNTTFFIIRAVVYFSIWSGLAFLLTSKSYQQDEHADPLLNWPMRKISGIGIVLYAIASTFASFDWIMSLDPNWFSSIYGPMFMTGHGLTALSFMLVLLVGHAHYTPYAEMVSQDRYHDLGKWLFALVVLWAYMMLSQFIIIWSGNLPEHIVWYLRRVDAPWKIVAMILTLLHFAVPFAVLLSRLTKQKSAVLVKVAFGLLLLRYVDLFWLIAPEVHQGAFVISWLDFVTPIAIGGVWLYFFFSILRAHPQRVAGDPRFEGVFEKSGGDHV